MANRFAVANGNFNDPATWSTTAAGSPGASPPAAGDNAIANTRTVTLTTNASCDSITNGTNYGGTAGGGFVLPDGVTLNAAIISGTATGVSCVIYSGATSAAIIGSVTGGNGTTSIGVTNAGSGTLNITNSAAHTGRAISNTSSGAIVITGNGTATGSGGSVPLITNSANGTITVIGSVTGGSGGASHGVSNTSNGAVNVTGSVTGGAISNAYGIYNSSTGTVTVNGTITATIAPAIFSSTATVRASGNFIYSSDGTIPISAPKLILNSTPTAAKTRYALNGSGTFVDMFTADNPGLAPAVNDVRAGIMYGSATGTLAVPAPGSVALGVPVDNTTGTAILTGESVASAVWDTLSTALTSPGSIGERLKNCSTADITGEQLSAALSANI